MVDGVPLKLKLRRAERMRKLKAVGLVAPLFLFIVVSFGIPIVVMLFNSIYDPYVAKLTPRTAVALAAWDGNDLPAEPVFEALALDLKDAQKAKQAALIGRRLNYELSGARSKLIVSAKAAAKLETGPYKEALIAADPMWGEHGTWTLLKRTTRAYTPYFFLSSIDLRYDANGEIEPVPEGEAVYQAVFVRTLLISATVTALTLVLGFPLAYLLATLPARTANILLIFVLMSFWTSLLVRTTAWFVLLQTQGPINDFLFYTGIVGERIQLIYTRFGTITAMTHIQLPFTLLPIYSVMKGISPSHVRAARSLGAGPFYAFWRVYFPQTMPGIAAGCLLTFILCLGYYITPSLVGGPTDQLISTYVALFVSSAGNWGMGSALGTILLVATLILFFIYNRLVGIERMRLN
ncbi:MAG: ABC transporter permease [Alphaproteobacteria bacterium]|nr:ABC transporter permease [Alphaproteobacteria bacterium]